MSALSFVLAALAFLLFALATDPHHRARLGRPCPKRSATMLRTTAWTLVALDFVTALLAWGSVFGPIGWVATLMTGAMLAFCALNFTPRRTTGR